MIESTIQRKVTAEQLAKLKSRLATMPVDPPNNMSPAMWAQSKVGLILITAELEKEIADWDKAKELTHAAYAALSGSHVDGHMAGLKLLGQARQLNPAAVAEVETEIEEEVESELD